MLCVAIIGLLFAGFVGFPFNQTKAAVLNTASVSLSDPRTSTASVTYTITQSGVTLAPIKCIKVQFSTAVTAGSKPSGMTITSLAFGGASNYVPTPASWTPTNTDATGVSTLTFATGETPASASARTVVLTGITNGNTAGTTYFVQFSTYNNVDCSTTPVDSNVIAFIYTSAQVVSGTVDPTLSISVASVASGQTVNAATTNITTTTTTVPFGTLSTGTNRIGAQDVTIGTNASGGYTLYIDYTGTFTNGAGGNISDHSGTNASPTTFSAAGTSAFGYTTNDATLGTGTAARFTSSGGNKWAAFTTSPVEAAYSATPVSETTRIGYQVGISATTPAGSYTTTVILTVTPIY